MTRRPALDGLRTFAVLAVILQHFGPTAFARTVDPGRLGVRLFFVLSGFLITGILLDARRAAGDDARGGVVRAFYVRRLIRIMPAYYLVLALGVALEPQIRGAWPWHAAYLSNHYVAALGHWPRAISHAWSLAVEEQFYLVWPWVVLFTPARWLDRVFLATCLLGPLSRGAIFVLTRSDLIASLPMTSALDTLGMGAWLARRWRIGRVAAGGVDAPIGDAPAIAPWAALAGVAAFVLAQVVSVNTVVRVALGDTCIALAFVWVVDRVARRARGTAWLTATPLVYIGTISYGVYLIHNFMPSLAVALVPTAARWIESKAVAPAVVVSVISIGLASASWFLLEAPLNGLKRYAPYVAARRQPPIRDAARARSASSASGFSQ